MKTILEIQDGFNMASESGWNDILEFPIEIRSASSILTLGLNLELILLVSLFVFEGIPIPFRCVVVVSLFVRKRCKVVCVKKSIY